jgi:phage shock protein PspC (stress-responsive transcriptional regulator)
MDTTTGPSTGGAPGAGTGGAGAPDGQAAPGAPGGPPRGIDSLFASIERLGIRRTDERWVSGTAGGVARRIGVDPLLVRGIWFVLCLFAGAGLVLYAIAWALLPDERDGRSLVEDVVHGQFRGGLVGAIVAFILGVNWRLSWWGSWGGRGWVAGTFWMCLLAGVAVIVAAVVGARSRDGGAGTAQPSTYSTAAYPTAASPTAANPTVAYPITSSAPFAEPAPAPAPAPGRPTKPPRERRRSGPIASAVVGLCLVAGAVVFGIDRAGHVSSPWLVWGGVSLVLLGLGIALAGLRGRTARGLTTLAILLGVLVLPAATLQRDGAFDGDVRAIAPDAPVVATDVVTAEDGYAYSVGDLTLDLTALPLPASGGDPVTVPVRVGAGTTVIEVPHGAQVRAVVRLFAGDVDWLVGPSAQHASDHGGHAQRDTFETSGVAAGGEPQLVLDVTAAAGTVTIEEKS